MKKSIEFDVAEPCGCESGRAYGSCCKGPRLRYVRDGKGEVSKSISLTDDAVQTLREAQADFRQAFRRSPKKGDRTFLVAYRHSPADTEKLFNKIAEKADVPGWLIYARKATDGLILTQENQELASPKDREDWDAAVAEYLEAAESGIDLLCPSPGPLVQAMDLFENFIEDAVVHLGSYVVRAPRATRTNLHLFKQFLLLSKCHQCAKMIADAWSREPGDEVYALVRTIYECTLTIARLEKDPQYANAMVAQALNGSEAFTYRRKNNGKLDFSKIVEVQTGNEYPARTSYADCARKAGEEHEAFFNVLYPILGDQVHFESFSLLQNYRESGEFLIWKEPRPPVYALYATIVLAYLSLILTSLGGLTSILRRDAGVLADKAREVFYPLVMAYEDDDYEIEAQALVAAFVADRLFRGEPLNEETGTDLPLER